MDDVSACTSESAPTVVVMFHTFGPYHCARLETGTDGMKAVGLEVNARDERYAWDQEALNPAFDKVTLFGRGNEGAMTRWRTIKKVWRTLTELRPSAVVLPGWSELAALVGIAWAWWRKVPVVLMSDSRREDQPRATWRERLKRMVVCRCQSALVAGRPHVEYFVSLGMPRDRIFTGYDVVDNDYFRDKAEGARLQAAEVRARYGVPKRYFLVVARLIPEKNLESLFKAYAQYVSSAREGWDLVILGDGPLRDRLEALRDELKLRDSIWMPGFKDYDELPMWYGLAGAFILASTKDTWGLVVNEAMAAGLPVLVSQGCGCCDDLVSEGENGFTFDPVSEWEMAETMRFIAEDSDVKAMGSKSQEIIDQWPLRRFGQGLLEAVEVGRMGK